MPRKLKNLTTEYRLNLDELPCDSQGIVEWDRVFSRDGPLRIEIGVGNSPFLIEVARRSPAYCYVGFEYCARRTLKFLKKVKAAELDCIRMLPVDATTVIQRIFRSESVDHIYINHPDPWPKRRHAKKRLVREENARTFSRLLQPGGGLSLRTDSSAYAHQMLEVLDATPNLDNRYGRGAFATAPLEPYPTPFETKFRELGSKIYYLEYRRR